MKEEKYLIEKCGKANPFKTPEGYFENFTRNIMEQLPEKEIQAVPETTLWHRIRPWMYMAAMFCGLMFGARLFLHDTETTQEESASSLQLFSSTLPDEYIDPIVDQTMMDDYTLYQYLTDADMEIYK